MYTSRFATEQDIDNIVNLVQSAYRGDASRVGWTTEADLLDGQRTDADEVSALIQQPGSYLLLCEQQGELLASVHLQDRTEFAYLGMFAVRPEMQGRGIGRYLLTEAERISFDTWHRDLLQMTVISLRQDLIAWYQRRGYTLTNEFVDFPYGQPRYGLPKREDLVLQVLVKSVSDYR